MNIMKEHFQDSSGNMEYLGNGFEFCNTVKTTNKALEIPHTMKKSPTRNSEPPKSNMYLFVTKQWKKPAKSSFPACFEEYLRSQWRFWHDFFFKMRASTSSNEWWKPRFKIPTSSRVIEWNVHFLSFLTRPWLLLRALAAKNEFCQTSRWCPKVAYIV